MLKEHRLYLHGMVQTRGIMHSEPGHMQGSHTSVCFDCRETP